MRLVTTGVVRSDVKTFLYHIATPLLCLVACTVFTGVFFAKASDNRYFFNYNGASSKSDNFICSPSGDVVFLWSFTGNFLWDPSLFLSITMGSGRLSFSAAKAIDIIWDLVVGRGGQLLLSGLAYPIVRQALLDSMERKPMRMPVVAQLTFDHGSLYTLWTISKDICRRWSWKLFAFVWIFVYLIAFGTIVSAMTGYQANSRPYYKEDGSENLLSLSDINVAEAMMLIDGSRVGLEDDTLVYNNETDTSSALLAYYSVVQAFCNSSNMPYRTNGSSSGALTSLDLRLAQHFYPIYPYVLVVEPDISWFNISWTTPENEHSAPSGQFEYLTEEYGGSEDDWSMINCSATILTLNGRNFSFDASALSFGYLPTSISPYLQSSVLLDQNNQIINQTWLEQPGVSECKPESTYQWGFSSLMLFCFCIATTLYAALLLALHIEVWYRSQTNRLEQDFSLYRDILDFADVLREHLGVKVDNKPAKALEKSVIAETEGVSVCAYECPPSRAQAFRPRFKRIGSELKAGHEYSLAETKRSLGLTYGPVWKHPDVRGKFDEV